MENELKNLGEFHEHYGRFPYIVHRMFPGIYMQIPVLFTYEQEAKNLPGITVALKSEKHAWPEVLQTDAMRNQLKRIARNVKRNIEQKHNREAQLCLVISPNECIYLSESGENESTQPPFGGTLCNTEGKPMILAIENHWRESDYEARPRKRT
jgi:hypothetical protein